MALVGCGGAARHAVPASRLVGWSGGGAGPLELLMASVGCVSVVGHVGLALAYVGWGGVAEPPVSVAMLGVDGGGAGHLVPAFTLVFGCGGVGHRVAVPDTWCR